MQNRKNKITEKTFPKYAPNTLVASLPPYLKDPANYKKVRKVIYDAFTGSCRKDHGEMEDWATCRQCQQRFAERGHIMRKLGFQSPAQYMAWQRVHEEIIKRVPLPKYK